jgi:hypothetical protein
MKRKNMFMKCTTIFLAMLGFSFFFSCGARTAWGGVDRKKAELYKADITELEQSYKSSSDDATRTERLRSILEIEVIKTGDVDSALKRFSSNEGLLSNDSMSRIYIAVAQCIKAGRMKKTEDKLAWLMKGMKGFDDLRSEYPDDELVYIYQASTYSNFPVEVGSRDEVLDLLATMSERYTSGSWSLSEGTAGQIAVIYKTLASIYKDAESSSIIETSRREFAQGNPRFADILEGRAVKTSTDTATKR